MPVQLKNNARSLLAVSISELDTIIRVRVGHGERFPALGDAEWFPLVLVSDNGDVEIMRAVSRSGDAITVRRAQAGTTAKPFPAGTHTSLRLTQEAMTSYISGEDPPDPGDGSDPDYGGTGLILNGLIANAYHNETGRQGYFHQSSGTSEGQYVFISAAYFARDAIQEFIDDNQPGPDVMSLTGTLIPYMPNAEYEGRLQINHAVGLCTVQQTGGDVLPPGSTIEVDAVTKEVVVKWPAYAVLPGDPIANGDFERGDEGWIKGSGWAIETTGNGNDGHGTYVAVYRGYGDSRLESQAFSPCDPGVMIPVRANVQQGASRAGSCGATVGLRYYDADQELITERFGNPVWDGARGRWHYSTLTADCPDGTAFVRTVILGGRKAENKPLWVDDCAWSIPKEIGTDASTEYSLSLRVTDVMGTTADWSGLIGTDRYPAEVLLDQPVLYLKLNEAAGVKTYKDYSGNGMDAATTQEYFGGAPSPVNQAGELRRGGQSAQFGASTNLAVMPNAPNFSKLNFAASANFALECVIELPEVIGSDAPFILSKPQNPGSTNGYNAYMLRFNGSRNIKFGWTNTGSGSSREVESPTPIEADKKYHIVGVTETKNGITSASLYINGRLVDRRNDSSMQALPEDNNSLFFIGTLSSFASWGWNGKISDVALYDHPIKSARAAEHARAAGLMVPQPVAWDLTTQLDTDAPITGGDDGTWVEVVANGATTFRMQSVRAGIWLDEGDWYWESLSRWGVYGGAYQWAYVGFANSKWDNTAGIGSYAGSAGAMYLLNGENKVGGWVSGGNSGSLLQPWNSPAQGEYTRIRHRLTIDSTTGNAVYRVAVEDGPWTTVAQNVGDGPFTVGASIRGNTFDSPGNNNPTIYARARIISMAEDFAFPVPAGALALSEA